MSSAATASAKPDGGCLCGAVTFKLRPGSRPYWTVICHCKNCQKATGSAFATSGIFAKDDVTLGNARHALRVYVDGDTESGTALVRKFCGRCGSPLFATTALSPDIVSVFGGAFNDNSNKNNNNNDDNDDDDDHSGGGRLLAPPFKEQFVDSRKEWLPDFGHVLISRHPRGCHSFARDDDLHVMDLMGEDE